MPHKMMALLLKVISFSYLHLPRCLTIPNELVSLDTSANVMKILSETIPTSHPQEVLGSKQNTSLSVSVPANTDTYATLTSVVPDTYDKQDISNIFDSLLQKWPDTSPFPDPSAEVSPRSLFESGALFPVHLAPL